MTVRFFVVGSLLTAAGSGAIWFFIIKFLDPLRAGLVGYSLFFLTLFLVVASAGGLIGYVIRRVLAPEQLPTYAVRSALRQGVLVALFLDLLLVLQLIRLYQWWLAVIAIILFIVTELIFLSHDQAYRRRVRSTQA